MAILAAVLFTFAWVVDEVASAVVLGIAGFVPLTFSLLIGEEALAALYLWIDVDAQSVRLRLPRRRGHVRRTRIDETVPLAAIAAVETRTEAFVQLGHAAIQQSWRIRLAGGRTIDLGSDRQMRRELFGVAATEIARRTRLGVEDFGAVEGQAGILAACRTRLPVWSHAAGSERALDDRMAETRRTWRITNWLLVLAEMLRLLGRR